MITYSRLELLFTRKLPRTKSYSLFSTTDFQKFREFLPKKIILFTFPSFGVDTLFQTVLLTIEFCVNNENED